MDEKITEEWLNENSDFVEQNAPYHYGFNLKQNSGHVRILYVHKDIDVTEVQCFLSKFLNPGEHDEKEQTFNLGSFKYIHEIVTLLKLIKRKKDDN